MPFFLNQTFVPKFQAQVFVDITSRRSSITSSKLNSSRIWVGGWTFPKHGFKHKGKTLPKMQVGYFICFNSSKQTKTNWIHQQFLFPILHKQHKWATSTVPTGSFVVRWIHGFLRWAKPRSSKNGIHQIHISKARCAPIKDRCFYGIVDPFFFRAEHLKKGETGGDFIPKEFFQSTYNWWLWGPTL